LQPQ